METILPTRTRYCRLGTPGYFAPEQKSYGKLTRDNQRFQHDPPQFKWRMDHPPFIDRQSGSTPWNGRVLKGFTSIWGKVWTMCTLLERNPKVSARVEPQIELLMTKEDVFTDVNDSKYTLSQVIETAATPEYSKLLRSTIRDCLASDPTKRPAFSDLNEIC